jgi:hypothetical protein
LGIETRFVVHAMKKALSRFIKPLWVNRAFDAATFLS